MKSNDINKIQQDREILDQYYNFFHIERLIKRIDKLEEELSEINRRLDKNTQILCQTRLSPFKCPVCEGKCGTIICGIIDEDCRACDGKGVLWG